MNPDEVRELRRRGQRVRQLREEPTAVGVVVRMCQVPEDTAVWDALLEVARRVDEMEKGERGVRI